MNIPAVYFSKQKPTDPIENNRFLFTKHDFNIRVSKSNLDTIDPCSLPQVDSCD